MVIISKFVHWKVANAETSAGDVDIAGMECPTMVGDIFTAQKVLIFTSVDGGDMDGGVASAVVHIG
jgi:hypothetical protein